jgi:hypothetical protein
MIWRTDSEYQSSDNSYNTNDTILNTQIFKLSDLDPQSVTVTENTAFDGQFISRDNVTLTKTYDVYVGTTYKKPIISEHSEDKKVEYSIYNRNQGGDYPRITNFANNFMGTSIQFTVANKDTADQVAKAFAYAIRLSGGQVTKDLHF